MLTYLHASWTVASQLGTLRPNSITLSGRRQVRNWSQTCSELEFGLSSNSLQGRSHVFCSGGQGMIRGAYDSK